MANLSLRDAARRFQVSRPTLTRALNDGRLSGVRDGQGRWQIDPAELARLYHPRPSTAANTDPPNPDTFTSANTPDEIAQLRVALDLAEHRADAAEALAAERAERIEDLRRLLPPPEHGRRWWRFWK